MTRKRTSENDLSLTAGASAPPVRRKSASRPRTKHTATPETPTTSAAAEPEIAAPIAAPISAAVYQPRHEEIAELAFLYWEARGYQGGCPEEDWLRAEQELRARSASV